MRIVSDQGRIRRLDGGSGRVEDWIEGAERIDAFIVERAPIGALAYLECVSMV